MALLSPIKVAMLWYSWHGLAGHSLLPCRGLFLLGFISTDVSESPDCQPAKSTIFVYCVRRTTYQPCVSTLRTAPLPFGHDTLRQEQPIVNSSLPSLVTTHYIMITHFIRRLFGCGAQMYRQSAACQSVSPSLPRWLGCWWSI